MKPQRVFAIACCALGIIAFSQLLISGIALAARLEQNQKVRIVEREVEKIVPYYVTPPGAAPLSSPPAPLDTLPRPPADSASSPVVPNPTPLTTPPIANPRAERLINEARTARVAGDMGMAIVKLEEALKESPDEPNALYELGLVHEMMGVYERASYFYEKVFQLGVGRSGELYKSAASKLRDGFEQPGDLRGKIALGRVRVFKDPKTDQDERVILSIPVIKAPDQEVQLPDLQVEVHFFNKTSKGEIVKLEDKSWATMNWATLPFDWAGGEETLRVDYVIPSRDTQTNHLFGELDYYGQVATLSYKNEILDVQAWPRDLAARIGQNSQSDPNVNDFPEFLDMDSLPPNFDPAIPLLPLPSN